MTTILYSSQLVENVSKRIRVIEPLERLAEADDFECVALERVVGRVGPRLELDQAAIGAADAMFLFITDLNRNSAAMLAPALRLALESGVALICDTDDQYFEPHGSSPFDEPLEPHLPHLRELVQRAHALTVTGPFLREEMRSYNPNVLVIPNAVDTRAYRMRDRASDTPRVGWCGGPTHLQDLTLILPAIRRLQRRYDFELWLFGLFDQPMHEVVERARRVEGSENPHDPYVAAFLSLARALEGVRYRHLASVPYPEFPRRLAELDLDIGLCPLRDTRFNRCKSAVKFYQYAAVGTVTLASDVPPYAGECGHVARNTVEDWEAKLSRLIDDAEFREATLTAQRQYVLARRTLETSLPLYREVLTRIPALVRERQRTG